MLKILVPRHWKLTTNAQRGRNTSFIVKDVYIRYRFPVTWPDSVSTSVGRGLATEFRSPSDNGNQKTYGIY